MLFQLQQGGFGRTGRQSSYPGGGGGGGTDPSFANVSLLLHMDGTNGSTTFTDSSSNGLSTAQQVSVALDTGLKKFGTASADFNGGLRYASSSLFGFGTGDWTIEGWLNITGGGNETVWSCLTSGGDQPHVYHASGPIRYYNNGSDRITGSVNLSGLGFKHVALCRVSGVTRLFIDGTQDGSSYTDSSDYGSSQQFALGDYNNPLSGGSFFQGWMDDVRVTKGVGRYASNFTAPTAAFPNS